MARRETQAGTEPEGGTEQGVLALGPPQPSSGDPAAPAESGGVPGEPEWLRAAEDAADNPPDAETAETAAPADTSPPAHDGPGAEEPTSPGSGTAGNGEPAGPDGDRLRQF